MEREEVEGENLNHIPEMKVGGPQWRCHHKVMKEGRGEKEREWLMVKNNNMNFSSVHA